MASAGTIERLYKVTVDGTEAVRNLKKVADTTAEIDSKLEAFASTVKKAGVALTAAFGVREVIDRITSLSESFDQLGKDAAKIGVGAEELQRLRYAADFAGVSAETMDKAIAGLAVSIQHLDVASDDATKTLKAIGVTGADSPTAALEKIADRFASLPDGVEKTAEAIALFGKKAGPDLIPMLNDGAKGVKALADELDRFGGVVSQNTISQAAAFNDNLTRLQKASAGAAAQFTAGLLPALQTLTEQMVAATKTGDGFKAWGEVVGEQLVKISALAILGANAFQKIAAVGQFAFSTQDMSTSIATLNKRLDALTTQGSDRLLALSDAWVKASLAASGHGEAAAAAGKKSTNALEEAAAAAKAQQEAVEALQKLLAQEADDEKAAGDEAVKAGEKRLAIILEQTQALEDQKQAEVGVAAAREAGAKPVDPAEQRLLDLRNEQTNALLKWKDANAEAATNEQIWREMLDEVGDKADEASVAIRNFAQARLNADQVTTTATENLKHQRDEMDAVGQGWEGFVDALSSGSVTVSEAFSGMVKSIIADLLKIWAQRYIINAIFGGAASGGSGGGGGKGALGLVFDEGKLQRFAQGGILSGPVRMPMALMGEAGPEAVMPLKRTADGALGVRAAQAPLRVQIHNYAGAQVSAKRDGSGDLQVIIEATKQSIAADFQRGGNTISRSAEAAWRLSRGAAAPF